jgi:hypothetical protein
MFFIVPHGTVAQQERTAIIPSSTRDVRLEYAAGTLVAQDIPIRRKPRLKKSGFYFYVKAPPENREGLLQSCQGKSRLLDRLDGVLQHRLGVTRIMDTV